jgi:hypothetical protein
MGDTVPNTVADLMLSASVSGSSGSELQWVRDGEVVSTVRVTDAQSTILPAKPRPGDWFTVIVRDDRGPKLYGNAIHIER